jgi:hypothetical protein
MKIICVLMAVIMLMGPLDSFAALGASNVIRVSSPTWTSVGRSTIAGVNTVKAIKYVRSVTGWAGLGLMAASLAYEYMPIAQGKWFDWIGFNPNLRLENGVVQHNGGSGTPARLDATTMAQIGTSLNAIYGPLYYANSAAADAGAAAIQAAYPGLFYKGAKNYNPSRFAEFSLAYAAAPYTLWCYFVWPQGAGSYVAAQQGGWQTATASDLSTEYATDLANPGTEAGEAARRAWEAAETGLQQGVNDPGMSGNPRPADIEDYKSRVWTDIGEDAQAALDAEVDPQPGEEATSEEAWGIDLLAILKTWWEWVTGGTPESIENVGVTASENETVLNSGDIAGSIESEKGITLGLLGDLKGAFTGLNTKIMTQLNEILPNGTGVCSMSTQIMGKTVTISYCNFDFTTIRGLVIGMAAIVGCMILIL